MGWKGGKIYQRIIDFLCLKYRPDIGRIYSLRKNQILQFVFSTVLFVALLIFVPVLNLLGLADAPIERQSIDPSGLDKSYVINAFDNAASLLTTLSLALFGLVTVACGALQNRIVIAVNFFTAVSLCFIFSQLAAYYLGFSARVAMLESLSLGSERFDFPVLLLARQAIALNVSFALAIVLMMQLCRESPES